MEKMTLVFFWNSGNSQCGNEAGSKTKVDHIDHKCYKEKTILNQRMLIMGKYHFTYII